VSSKEGAKGYPKDVGLQSGSATRKNKEFAMIAVYQQSEVAQKETTRVLE
jgi:hypothetical protein